jgi:hypothetical protein
MEAAQKYCVTPGWSYGRTGLAVAWPPLTAESQKRVPGSARLQSSKNLNHMCRRANREWSLARSCRRSDKGRGLLIQERNLLSCEGLRFGKSRF